MDAFIKLQFNGCLVSWIFHKSTINSRLKYTHEHSYSHAEMVKMSKISFSFIIWLDILGISDRVTGPLEKFRIKSVTTHQSNLQLLMSETFNAKNNLNEFSWETALLIKMTTTVWNENNFQLPKAKRTANEIESIQYRGYLLLSTLLNET